MKSTKPLLLVTAVAMAGVPAVALSSPAEDAMRALQRLGGQYMILMARSFVDLTYESLSIEPGTDNLILSDVILYPELPWDESFACEVTIDRAVVGSAGGFESVATAIEISGMNMPTACLDPEVGGMLGMFGYGDGLTAETVSIDIAYDLPSSAADVTVQAAVAEAADVTITAGFNYLWVRLPVDGGDPQPVAYLGEAEVAIENRGLWERLEPMVAQQVGDVNQLPGMIQGMLGQMLGGGGASSPEAQAFVENLAAEVGRFVQNKDRLVVSVAPESGVYLDENTFGSPTEAIAILQPMVSGAPLALQRMIMPEELAAALGGGEELDDDARLRVGTALMTGVGAPRSISDGRMLLQPLVDSWNGAAALVVADALSQTGPADEAYELAMIALAGGESRAIGIADRLEGDMDTATLLGAQDRMGDAWPTGGDVENQMRGMMQSGDIAGLRLMAQNIAVGRGTPRSYAGAYFLASLAAAAGDRGAANLRDRLDRRFGQDEAWRGEAEEAASLALQVWTNGLAATVAARLQ